MSDTPVETYRYEVNYDPAALRRMAWKMVRLCGLQWFNRAGCNAFYLLVCSLLVAVLVTMHLDVKPEFEYVIFPAAMVSIMIAGLVAFGEMLIFVSRYSTQKYDSLNLPELTSEGYAYWPEAHTQFFIPWSAMKSATECPDGWLVGRSMFCHAVFRGPLRDAGLEEEFRRRMTAAAPPAER